MANVEWSAGIDSVSGALAKPSKRGHHSCKKMLLGTHRTAATTSDKCNRLYLRNQEKRTSPLTPREVSARARFSTVSQMIKLRKEDLSKITEDQANFIAQKDKSDGVRTMLAYYWKICGAEYDSKH